MSYAIDGIPLDNPALGWVFRSLSTPIPTFGWERPDLTNVGRDGVVPGLPAHLSAPSPTLVVQTARENLGALISLTASGTYLTRTGATGKRVEYELVEMAPEEYSGGAIIDATFTIRFPGAYWRDTIETTSPAVALTASVAINVFSGITAPVQDAVVRIKGAAGGLRVADAAGSWFMFPTITAGQYLRFEADTGQAFITTTDTWSGGTNASGDVDFGGGRGTFEITPSYTTDPGVRSGLLVVTTASRTGAQIQVRGRGAHVV